MPTMDQRLALLEQRVEAIEAAHDRNTEFLVKKAVEHATRLDHLQADVTEIKGDIKSIISGIDAMPSIIARTMHEVLDARDKRGSH